MTTKIAIYGAYNGTSVGDTAILVGLLRAISQVFPDADVTVLTQGPIDFSRDASLCGLDRPPTMVRTNVYRIAEWPLVQSLWWRLARRGLAPKIKFNKARCQSILKKQDVLIIGGGNLLMDLYETHVDTLASVIETARSLGLPYCFAGVGAGPITGTSAALKLTNILSEAFEVFVRDTASSTVCLEQLGAPEVKVGPDLAFGMGLHIYRLNPERRGVLAVNVAAVGASTWPKPDDLVYQKMLNGMVRLLDTAVKRLKPTQIRIVSTNPAVDGVAARDLAQLLATILNISIETVDCHDVTDALTAFNDADLAITTRLHAGILAALSGCRVLPIAYQPKVSGVLISQGIALDTLTLADLSNTSTEFDKAIQEFPSRLAQAPDAQVTAIIADLVKASQSKVPTEKSELSL